MRYRSFSHRSGPEKYPQDICSERNLAFAILKQAWREALIDMGVVKESARNDYGTLKMKAIQWISNDNQGFLYWCQLADVNYQEVRQKLNEALRVQNHTG